MSTVKNSFYLVLKSVKSISPYVKHFEFDVELENFHYIPGQFITIHFEKNGQKLHRSYSIASIPEGKKTIEFAAGYVEGGPATELLFNLKPSEKLETTGPFGRLILKEAVPKRYIFVATSTGVTPFRCMLKQLEERLMQYPELEVVLLEGVQHQRDLLYAEDFLDFAQKYPRFRFRACYSRETLSDPKPFEYSGYVQSLFSELALNPEADVVYLCGNPGMIDESFLALKEKGFDVKNIYREKYISNNPKPSIETD